MSARIFPLLVPLLASLTMASAVSAQEPSNGPVLQEASVRVVQNRADAEVTERLVVTGGGEGIEHVLALGLDPVVPGVLVSSLLFVAVSLATRPSAETALAPLFGDHGGRGTSETATQQSVRGGAA